MAEKSSLLTVTTTEAFEFGKLEGTKGALKEVLELADADPQFIKKYCEARLKTINDTSHFLAKVKGSLS